MARRGAGWARSRSSAGAAARPSPRSEPPAVELDRVIHERMRLAIVSALAVNDALAFNDLKALLRTTDGNLSVHARKLEDAGYIACKKKFASRVPKTQYSLTVKGKRMFARHLEHMESLIHAAKGK